MIFAVNGKAGRLLLAACLLLPVHLFAATASEADPVEQFERAIQVMTGDGVRKSESEGIRILKRSAKAGYLPAQNHLAICYQTGTGFIFRSKRKAERWFLTAAEAGYLPALFNLAQLYLTTDEKNGEAKARRWLEKAARYELSEDDGDEAELFAETKASACTLLGQQLLEAEDKALWPTARAYFEVGANLGDLTAQLNAARCYALGMGTEANLDEAERFLDNAGRNLATRIRRVRETYYTAALISAHTAYTLEEEASEQAEELVKDMWLRLAMEMADSEEVANDPQRALQWFIKAAEAGSEFAKARLGIIWLRGDAREGISEEAVVGSLEDAVEAKVTIASFALGYYYANLAQPRNPIRAQKLYDYARLEGVYAAHLAMEGDRSILPMTFAESMKLAHRDAPSGNMHARFATAVAAWYGIGKDVDRQSAAERFQEVAELGHPEAAYYTGMAYLSGHLRKFNLFDGQASLKQAHSLLQQGANTGSDDALYMLGLFKLVGIGLKGPDFAGAMACFQQLRDKGDLKRGANGIGDVHFAPHNPARNPTAALQAYRASAEAGDVDSMTRVAEILIDGDTGVSRDLEEGFKWAQKAIDEDDDARGHYYLGRYYQRQDPPDLGRAYASFEDAAYDNHEEAMKKVAEGYRTADGVPFNPNIAGEFYQRLVYRGENHYIDDWLEMLHAAGEESVLKAALDEIKAAGVRNKKATVYRDIFKHQEARTREDRVRAYRSLLSAAKKGDGDAQVYILQLNQTAEKPSSTVRKIGEKLSAAKNPDAYFYLSRGMAFSDRWKIKRDPAEMVREAAQAGSAVALKFLNDERLAGKPDAPTTSVLKDWLQPWVDKGYEDAIEIYDSIIEEEMPETERRELDEASGFQEMIG